jgi:hypothetical protein
MRRTRLTREREREREREMNEGEEGGERAGGGLDGWV